MRSVHLSLLIAFLATTSPATAQELPLPLPVPLEGVVSYDAAVPAPQDVIGHMIGTRHTEPAEIVAYFEAVSRQSDRVALGEHGETYEGRPLVHAIVTSAANHARLEEIRRANLMLSDSPGSVSDADVAGMPTVVYMGYSVHGNEASGSEAALLFLYHLAAGNGPWIESVLENTVMLIDPSLNPDGRNRFVDWVNQNRGRVPTRDVEDREHNEPWPGGRTNHYLFDLNRDWLPGQLPESRGRLELFHSWRPQVLTDFHEMGGNATYFFQPGIPSRNNPNTPEGTFELTQAIAERHADYLDRIGSLYYSRESFDDFYYGKGSTYPDINGAVGILFEQASSRALETETQYGALTYAFTVRNHFMTSLSTATAAVDLRERLLRHQRDFYGSASAAARSFPARAYVFGSPDRWTRTQELARLLRRHRVRVYELARAYEADGTRYARGAAYVVPVDQPQARLIKAVMERTTEFTDSLFYDVSTWTTPLAFGVPASEVRGDPGNLLGGAVDVVQLGGGSVEQRSDVAYLVEPGRYYLYRGLYRLQEAGVIPLLLMEPFEATLADGSRRGFRAGTVVIPVEARDPEGPDPETVHDLVRRLAAEDHLVIYGVASGLTPSGVDLGSAGATGLRRPQVALIAGSGTSAYRVGEVWHLLNERMGVPVSLLNADDVGGADLDRYNTVVMAGYFSGLSDGAQDRLEQWTRAGGLLIAVDNVGWVVERGLVSVSRIEDEENEDEEPEIIPYADVSERFGAQQIGGSIFEALLDNTHPIGFGHPDRVALFRSGRSLFHVSEAPGANVARYSASPLLSGYISAEMLERLPNTAAIIAERAGAGRVVVFVDNPNFRAFWYGTNGLFLNAVFWGHVF